MSLSKTPEPPRFGPIHVRADDRERGAGVIEALDRVGDVELTVERLRLADYQVDGRLAFERKTLADLVQSIKDGRLFKQARRLATASIQGVFLLAVIAAANRRVEQLKQDGLRGSIEPTVRARLQQPSHRET